MLRIDFGFFSVMVVWRAVLGVFAVCVLVVSGLFWGGPDAAGKIKVDPRSPINTESLEGLEMRNAHGYDAEDGFLGSSAFSWHSSLDGSLGAGGLLIIAVSDLSIGDHVITVTATDSDIRGNAGKDTITPGAGEDTILGITLDDTIY